MHVVHQDMRPASATRTYVRFDVSGQRYAAVGSRAG